MPYNSIKPCKQLQPYIENIWIQDDDRDALQHDFRPTIVLPAAKIDFLFYYRDRFIQIENKNEELLPRSYVVGQRTKPIEVKASGKTGIIIVSFYPWGVHPFLNLPLNELKDRSIDLKQIFNADEVSHLEEKLCEAESSTRRITLVQNFLIKTLKDKNDDFRIQRSIRNIMSSPGNMRHSSYYTESFMSKRNFIRKFKSFVGLSPKLFSNIIRFQKANHYLNNGLSWRDIIFHCGYFDQSHFIKEIKKFSGFTPTEVFGQSTQTTLMRHFNNNSNSAQFYNTIYL